MSKEQSFKSSCWFEELFGFRESPKKVNDNIKCTVKGDVTDLKSNLKERVYNAGNFQVRSSDRSTFESIPQKGSGGGKLNIIHGYGRGSKHFELIDILAMQSLPAWNGATYLAASNFNCLEFVSPGQTASDGVTYYYADPTQGPYTALACGPACVYRNYFIEHDGVSGQIKSQIELLKDTPIPVTNGYAIIHSDDDLAKKFLDEEPEHEEEKKGIFKKLFSRKPKESPKLDKARKKLSEFDWSNPSIWKVGVHRNCEVVMKRGKNNGFAYSPPGLIAHHVYAAAFNFASDVTRTDLTTKITNELLTAEYRASILAAWENSIKFPGRPGSKKLSLTLLGGGVFHNSMDDICGAIRANIELIKESGLDVYITCFNDSIFRSVNAYLSDMVKETGGRIVDSNNDDDCLELMGNEEEDDEDDEKDDDASNAHKESAGEKADNSNKNEDDDASNASKESAGEKVVEPSNNHKESTGEKADNSDKNDDDDNKESEGKKVVDSNNEIKESTEEKADNTNDDHKDSEDKKSDSSDNDDEHKESTDEKADNTNEDDHKDSEDEKSDGSHNDDDHKESANKKSSDSNDDKEKSTDEKE